MGRPPRKEPETITTEVNTEALDKAHKALPVLAAQAGEVMDAVGYELPYERERVVQETRFYMERSAEAALEAGRRLLVMKAHEPHGEFEAIVRERLGMSERTAQSIMAGATKYLLNPALESAAPTLLTLGKTKLLELMTEPDDELVALATGGTLAGKKLDEIDAMSSRELKAALREAREEKAAGEQLLGEKNKTIDKLKSAQRRIEKLPPDEQLKQLQTEAVSLMNDVSGGIRGSLRQALIALKNHSDEDESAFMAGLVAQVQMDLNELRDEFGLPQTDTTPEWQKWAKKQGQQEPQG